MDFLHYNRVRLSGTKEDPPACRRGSKCAFAHHGEITRWSPEKIFDGFLGSNIIKKATQEDINIIKKALKPK
jgi:hypothetical protein